ncbi:killer cell lectin-like receptor subfamily B member 1B allele B [Phyllobates terribilis]|uniref:killer cell lectin-like receptor subfamily B member 1B allele B n=1 Tax=Phyllobates terribilis TaxID=111132 RepID=UPI003CCADFC6
METSDKRRVWTPSWKGVIITVLVGVIIILIRIIEALVYNLICEHPAIMKELCINRTDISGGCLLCPPDWRLHGDHCYYYSDVTERTWNQSRDDCKMMGADLLVIKDQEQQEIIQRSITQQVEKAYWIGLHRDGDVWRWVDGEHYSGSLLGRMLQSQGPGCCVLMTGSDYYQNNCDTARRWICVKEAVRI